MTAEEYIAELTRLLYSLPEQEREEALAFYRESIADRMDDGFTEEEAVASLASPTEAACAILSNRAESAPEPQPGPVAEAATESAAARPSFWARLKRGQLTPLEWVGVILSSVIWLPLLAAAIGVAAGVFAVILSLYLCVWVLIGCVWITGGAMVLAAPLNCAFILWGLQLGNVPYALVNAGYSLVAFGSGAWILRGALKLTKPFVRGHRKAACAARKQPWPPEAASSPQQPRPEWSMFFTICLILLGVGLACVLAGYALSGFDWRVFLTSFNENGTILIGGTQVKLPDLIPFDMPFA